MPRKTPQPPRRRRSRRRPRARRWAFLLLLTLAATCVALVVMGAFLLKTVNSFDGDEIKELTAMASIFGTVMVAVLKVWELVIKNYFA